jgi:hypothetical protein
VPAALLLLCGLELRMFGCYWFVKDNWIDLSMWIFMNGLREKLWTELLSCGSNM